MQTSSMEAASSTSSISETNLHALAGVFSRVACETIVSPLNLVKIRLQYDPSLRQSSLIKTVASIIRQEGFHGTFRGLPPRLLWTAPLASISFLYYEEARQLLANFKERTEGAEVMEGVNLPMILAGPPILALGVAIRTPFDIVEMRLQLLGQKKLPGTTQSVFKEKWQQHGVRGLFRGFGAAFATIGTFVVTYFLTYEQTRRVLRQNTFMRHSDTAINISSGMFAGALGAILTNPLDVVKTRIQTQANLEGASAVSAGASKVLVEEFPSMRTIYRETVREGHSALFSGLTPRLMTLSFAGAIIFSSYEASKTLLVWLTEQPRKSKTR